MCNVCVRNNNTKEIKKEEEEERRNELKSPLLSSNLNPLLKKIFLIYRDRRYSGLFIVIIEYIIYSLMLFVEEKEDRMNVSSDVASRALPCRPDCSNR